MAYEAQISRTNPAAFLFVVDQSGSMSDKMSSGRSKAEFVADALNRTLMNLITRCTKEGANKQVISSQADSLIKISRIWADFFPANTSNQPI